MNKRYCPWCKKEVAEDDICKCLKDKIQQKREELQTKEKASEIHCLVIGKDDFLVVQSKDLCIDKHFVTSMLEFFKGVKMLFLPVDVQLSVVKQADLPKESE
jgi:hypothetical protein